MNKQLLAFGDVPQLAKTDVAYATQNPALKHFYAYPPTLSSFSEIISKQASRQYPRKDVVDALTAQYQHLSSVEPVRSNIEALLSEKTFTVVTAHQPSLFLGPLYFIYKALSAIRLARAIEAEEKGKYRIVPVFVLGSEDHDLEELNKINLYGKRIEWQPGEQGPVGNMSSKSLRTPLEELAVILGSSEAAQALYARVEQAYTHTSTFASATQALLHEFLGRFGLIVLNMSDASLKRHFIPVMREELLHQHSFRLVNQTIEELQQIGFKTQAAPREINLFYLNGHSRERIVREENTYKVLNTSILFTEKEILDELEKYPERFSPNVILRPLFQEIVLPNLAYVGGGGELAYWLERRRLFEYFDVSYPVLVRRHSVMWIDRDAAKKLDKLGISSTHFFIDTDQLVRDFIARHATGAVDLQAEISDLEAIFKRVAQKATAIDPTLEKSALAESVKASAALEQWQSRLVRAEKQKHETALNQLKTLKDKFFPSHGLQERYDNVLPYLLKYGDAFLDTLLSHFEPFEQGFVVLEEQGN
jgi:bacillithiol synthase